MAATKTYDIERIEITITVNDREVGRINAVAQAQALAMPIQARADNVMMIRVSSTWKSKELKKKSLALFGASFFSLHDHASIALKS